MFITLPIIGSGTRDDAYRVDLPAGLAYSAHIPTARTGVPVYLDAMAWLDDDTVVPGNLTSKLRSESTARSLLLQRDPACSLESLKRPPQVRDATALLRVTLAEELFAGTDSTDIGTSWDAGYTGNVNLQRVGNRCRSTSTTSDGFETYNGVTCPNDQWGSFTIQTIQGASQCAPRIMLRAAAAPTMTSYEYLASRNIAAFRSRIAKWVAGVLTAISTENATTWAAGDRLYGEVIGTQHNLYRNGSSTALLSGTDSALASGRAGLLVNSIVIADTEVTNWLAGGFSPWQMRKTQFPP